ncbi:MAG: hypothetical protein AB1566_12410 [Chloroflexota bacterium]
MPNKRYLALLSLALLFLEGLLGACAPSVARPMPEARTPVPTTRPAVSIEYRNTQYGFSFSLPGSWKGYSIITDKWEGYTLGGPKGVVVVEQGPMISIRHPQWTSENPRQDIPIMVFTVAQWNALQQGKFYVSAAPINPGELGRNSRYVFALPARYNYAFPTGWEEVEKILESNPLHLFQPSSTTLGSAALTWERYLSAGCQTVIIDAQGQASFGPCSGPRSVAPILSFVERPRDLQHFLDRYQPFEADTPAGRIIFAGRGTQVATPSEKQAVAEWASLVHQELQFGRSGASWGLAVAFNQEGSNPCSRIQMEVYGKVFANDCSMGIQPYPTVWLTTEELDRLYAWMGKFQTFEMNWNEGGLPMRLVFGGRGNEAPTEADQREILAWVKDLYQSIAR